MEKASKLHIQSGNNRRTGFMPLYVGLDLGSTSSVGLLEDEGDDSDGMYKVPLIQLRDCWETHVPIANESALQLLVMEYAILHFKHQPEQII